MSSNWDKVKQSGLIGLFLLLGFIIGTMFGAVLVIALTHTPAAVSRQAALCSICEGLQEACVAEWWDEADIIDKCAKNIPECK